MVSRRAFMEACGLALPAAAFPTSLLAEKPFTSSPPFPRNSMAKIAGIDFGVQTYSFHDIARSGTDEEFDTIISYLDETGLAQCEIMSSFVEPRGRSETGWWRKSRLTPEWKAAREAAREWRTTVPESYYTAIAKRFAAAGKSIFIYNMNINDTFTDAERDATFRGAKAMGCKGLNGSIVVSEIPRIAPFAEKHQMFYAVHNHDNAANPDEIFSLDSFERSFAVSPWIRATLDIGHFAAGNQDPYEFIKKYHDRIVSIHVRDRKNNNGPHVPLGQGDARVADVLRLIRDQKYPIGCFIELEYATFLPPVEEVKRALMYCRNILV